MDLDSPTDGMELMVLPDGYDGDEDDLGLDDWDWVPVETVGAAIQYGLDNPARFYRLYLDGAEPWCGVVLAFTRPHGTVFGVSVDDPLSEPSALNRAQKVMARLEKLAGAKHGWIAGEEPPPLDPDRDRPWLRSIG